MLIKTQFTANFTRIGYFFEKFHEPVLSSYWNCVYVKGLLRLHKFNWFSYSMQVSGTHRFPLSAFFWRRRLSHSISRNISMLFTQAALQRFSRFLFSNEVKSHHAK